MEGARQSWRLRRVNRFDQRSLIILIVSLASYRDKVRGVLNEGGLFGERHGWHLPGFDTSSWASRKLSTGNPSSEAGIGFFVASFNLSMPQGYDIPMSFTFSEPPGQPYRVRPQI